MITLSEGSKLAYELASTETIFSKYEFITEDFLFLGIFSLDKAIKLMENHNNDLNQGNFQAIQSEYDEINDVMKNFNLNFETIRTELKGIMGTGNFKLSRKVVHRSDSCKQICAKANEIALDDFSIVRCIHILKALLIEPTDNLNALFEKLDIDINLFKSKFKNRYSKEDLVKPQVYESQNTILGRYGINLTQEAKEGRLTPVIGRDEELLQLVRTLSKHKKNNPLIIGEAGVGKTALVNALAIKIADGNVNKHLKDKVIIEISVASLVSGTKYRGQFEDKFHQLLNETRDNPNIILFIDEIHTILNAGAVEGGALDASNILKPALANGDLSLIGATTISEYRKYFERDAAFERRFQPILVTEPTSEDTITILKGLRKNYEEYHNVKITDEAISEAVNLSVRYITDRNLPDKALDVIDEACSRKIIPQLDASYDALEETSVSVNDVMAVVTDWTGIPVVKESSDFENLKNIDKFLKEYIVGQDEAIEKVSRRLKMSTLGIQNPEKPLAVFLFLGPTGVGKTYMSKLLAKYLFGNEDLLIRIDMSEYMGIESVSKLIGAAPGLIGYEEGGYLTDAIRNNPYSIVLIDEIEKAHPQIINIFLQLFDEGRLTDSKGKTVNARNCIFIMTSNLLISGKSNSFSDSDILYGGVSEKKVPEMDSASLMELLTQYFPSEFVNRIDVAVQFNELDDKDFKELVKLCINNISKRLLEEKNIKIDFDYDVVEYLTSKGFNKNFGARYLNKSVEESIEYPISDLILNGKIKNGDVLKVEVSKKGLKFMPINITGEGS